MTEKKEKVRNVRKKEEAGNYYDRTEFEVDQKESDGRSKA